MLRLSSLPCWEPLLAGDHVTPPLSTLLLGMSLSTWAAVFSTIMFIFQAQLKYQHLLCWHDGSFLPSQGNELVFVLLHRSVSAVSKCFSSTDSLFGLRIISYSLITMWAPQKAYFLLILASVCLADTEFLLVSLDGELEGLKIKSCWPNQTHRAGGPGFYF